MTSRFLIFIILGFFSCSGIRETHERLLSWKSQYIMEGSEEADGYFDDYENFIRPNYSENQVGDTLILSTLIPVNACGEIVANIRFSGDTLFLGAKYVGGNKCMSYSFNKFTFSVSNPEKVKYIIRTDK